jgi:hypothetical protein
MAVWTPGARERQESREVAYVRVTKGLGVEEAIVRVVVEGR